MSGAVGSRPSLTRSGLPVLAERSSLALRSSSRMRSTVAFLRRSSCSSIVIGSSVDILPEQASFNKQVFHRTRPQDLHLALMDWDLLERIDGRRTAAVSPREKNLAYFNNLTLFYFDTMPASDKIVFHRPVISGRFRVRISI